MPEFTAIYAACISNSFSDNLFYAATIDELGVRIKQKLPALEPITNIKIYNIITSKPVSDADYSKIMRILEE